MSEEDEAEALVSGLREVRDEARRAESAPPSLPPSERPDPSPASPLPPLEPSPTAQAARKSPDREALNELWDLNRGRGSEGGWLRRVLARAIRYAIGPAIERQVEMNSAQVRFDNEVVAYLDARLDALSAHYDEVLGLHGKRMEEIDERHLILQQELIRHVHDLVQRIEFVFETAETNHLYVDGMVRETKEQLKRSTEKLEELARSLDALAERPPREET